MFAHPRRAITVLFLGLLTVAIAAQAKPRTMRKFVANYPATTDSRLRDCASCHVPHKTELNPYGQALSDSGQRFAAVERLDSDGDGVLNVVEIKLLTFPGDAADRPDSAAVDSVTKRVKASAPAAADTAAGMATEKAGSKKKAKSKKSSKKHHDHDHDEDHDGGHEG